MNDLASVDTHAKRGDAVAAPSVMGSAVPKADAQVNRLIDDLLSRKTAPVEWLEQAGPIAAELGKESRDD